jgi:YegS/Rv2252/BmrU family lipid kinase
MGTSIVIGNPSAGRGKTKWDDVLAKLRAAGVDATGHLTERPGHAIELAQRARAEGVDLVIAAGGDGTVHEVANGLLRDGTGTDMPTLGVLPLGSGCDYAKTFGISDDIDQAVATIADERPPRIVDAGEITYRHDGAEARRYFVNIAEVGIGPETVARAASLPRSLGGAVYGLAFLMVLPIFRALDAKIAMDLERYDGRVMNLVVAVGQVFGGGMRVAPAADPSDGLFDVQVHFPSKVQYVASLPKVYKGTHLPHPKIKESMTATLEITADPPGLIEADGEVLGRTPATFRIVPGALRLKA